MRKTLMIAAAALALAAAPSASLAHHGWSSYDASELVRVTAPRSDVSWGNPHGAAKVVHEGKTWDVILAPVSRMEARGLTRDMLGPGKTVTLEGYVRRDGTAEMRLERIRAEGKTVELR
ncbi:MAG: DUF6152 family protein [Phenylobacterium sp.]|uniref:DUF6152 family protein n=1 Tax=Phenylobacterium sp. TaxID=1871053 RepID=UPI00271CB8A2|nr:DUF6152 family protein [Phenylobacterium sp.]MDO8900282.1 DUF6152 family protein [Phenylobacterium sp.]